MVRTHWVTREPAGCLGLYIKARASPYQETTVSHHQLLSRAWKGSLVPTVPTFPMGTAGATHQAGSFSANRFSFQITYHF